MTTEMIERVAKAICNRDASDDLWDEVSERTRDGYRQDARAAIEAMRDPTQEMVCSAERKHGLLEGFVAEEGWRTMIDAALTRSPSATPSGRSSTSDTDGTSARRD